MTNQQYLTRRKTLESQIRREDAYAFCVAFIALVSSAAYAVAVILMSVNLGALALLVGWALISYVAYCRFGVYRRHLADQLDQLNLDYNRQP